VGAGHRGDVSVGGHEVVSLVTGEGNRHLFRPEHTSVAEVDGEDVIAGSPITAVTDQADLRGRLAADRAGDVQAGNGHGPLPLAGRALIADDLVQAHPDE
jgi:hypothetical protein